MPMLTFDGPSHGHSKHGSCVALLVLACGATPAISEELAENQELVVQEDSAGANTEIEEIVVTASRREESLQKVSISITVLDAEEIETAAFNDFSDIARQVPSLQVTTRRSNENQIAIRGLSAPLATSASSSTVGVYIDETPVSAALIQPDPRLVDLERIEVLRGPQGTLYGEGSIGGTIRYITKRPETSEFSGSVMANVSTTAEGDESYGINGVVNIPLKQDVAAVRIAGYYIEDGGFVDNIQLDEENANYSENVGARANFLVTPSEKWEFRLTAAFEDTESNGLPRYRVDLDPYEFESPIPEELTTDFQLYNFGIYFRDTFGEISSNLSYFDRNHLNRFNNLGLFDFFGPAIVNHERNSEVLTEELRYTSPDELRTRVVAGLFYLDRANVDNVQVPLLNLGINFQDNQITVDQEKLALYSEVEYDVSEKVTLIAGIRYFEDSFEGGGTSALFGGPPEPVDTSSDVDGSTYKIGAEYHVNDDIMLYGIVASGFRSGGVNTLVADGSPAGYEHDTTQNYELGVKSTLANGSVVVNAALFRTDWSDIQILTSNGTIGYTDNGGEARSTGIEAELFWVPTDNFSLKLGGNYIDTETLNIVGFYALPVGSELARVPDYSFNFSANYAWNMTRNWMLDTRIDYTGLGERYTTMFASRTTIPASENLNFSLTFSKQRYWVSLYATNVLNDLQPLSSTIEDDNTYSITRPRTIGVRMSMDF